MTNIQHFIKSNDKIGIADAFDSQDIINMAKYGDGIGNFIIIIL